jgi:hypothetical protein
MRHGAAEAESCFLVARQDPHLETGDPLNLGEECLRVARFAYRARRDGIDPFGAELTRERRHSFDCLERRVHRRVGQRA